MDFFRIEAPATGRINAVIHLPEGTAYPTALDAFLALMGAVSGDEYSGEFLPQMTPRRLLSPSSRFYHEGYPVDYPVLPSSFVTFGGSHVPLYLQAVSLEEAGYGFIYTTGTEGRYYCALETQDGSSWVDDGETLYGLYWFLRKYLR